MGGPMAREEDRGVRYQIDGGGRLRHVTVSRAGSKFAITVDGRLHHVDGCA
jgi:hypothetical protein